MSSGDCCEAPTNGPGGESNAARVSRIGPRSSTVRRSWLGMAGCLVPGALLAVMPKCPACLAAYIAIATGLAISTTAAAYLRIAPVILCVASLSYLGARFIMGYLTDLSRH